MRRATAWPGWRLPLAAFGAALPLLLLLSDSVGRAGLVWLVGALLFPAPLQVWLLLARVRWWGITVGCGLLTAVAVTTLTVRWRDDPDWPLTLGDVGVLHGPVTALGCLVGILVDRRLARSRTVPPAPGLTSRGAVPLVLCLLFLLPCLVAPLGTPGIDDTTSEPTGVEVLPLPVGLVVADIDGECGANRRFCHTELTVVAGRDNTGSVLERVTVRLLVRGWPPGGGCRTRGLLLRQEACVSWAGDDDRAVVRVTYAVCDRPFLVGSCGGNPVRPG